MQGLQPYLAFAATARHGGFAAAAREQGLSPSTLAKAVGRLELTLGVKLFHRSTRQVRLTPDGERLYARCERLLAEIDELQAEAAGSRAAPSGTLRIDSSVYYGKRFVMPLLNRLLQQHPGLRLDLRLNDQQVDLVRDGIDLAVRIGPLRDSSLVARRIDWQGLVLCASPAYLQQHGRPQRLEDLAGHPAVAFRLPSSGRDRPWQFQQRGLAVELPVSARVRIGETESLLDATLHGWGLCQMPDLLAQPALDRGELIELLPQHRPAPLPIHLVYPSGRLLPARVRAAIDVLDALRQRAPR